MPSQFESEFVDADYEASRQQRAFAQPVAAVNPTPSVVSRAPSTEEIESRVTDAHSRLAELKRAQETLERERAQLEEARRRKLEYENGRSEMLTHLTRGVELLKEAEFNSRRDAEQMTKTLADLGEALQKVAALDESRWTKENWNNELTRALTTLENAQMEWNSARLKWPVLDGALKSGGVAVEKSAAKSANPFQGLSFFEMCKAGLALSWPVALVLLGGVIAITLALLQR